MKLNDAAQCLELMEKLLDSGYTICKIGNFYHVELWTDDANDRRECVFSIYGKTITETVTLAVSAHIQSLEKLEVY